VALQQRVAELGFEVCQTCTASRTADGALAEQDDGQGVARVGEVLHAHVWPCLRPAQAPGPSGVSATRRSGAGQNVELWDTMPQATTGAPLEAAFADPAQAAFEALHGVPSASEDIHWAWAAKCRGKAARPGALPPRPVLLYCLAV
jgi:hypothetical protein